jgi:hypothetical protein
LVTQEIHNPGSNDSKAAYFAAGQQDPFGTGALAGLFLLEHEFCRVPNKPHLVVFLLIVFQLYV